MKWCFFPHAVKINGTVYSWVYIVIELLAVITYTPLNSPHGTKQSNGEHQVHPDGHVYCADEVKMWSEGKIIHPVHLPGQMHKPPENQKTSHLPGPAMTWVV